MLKGLTPQLIITLFYTALYGMFVWFALTTPIPEGNQSMVDILLGILSTVEAMIIGYWFTSSMSAKEKNEALSKLLGFMERSKDES